MLRCLPSPTFRASNVFTLAFIFSSSYTDNAAVWAGLDASPAFGSTYLPTSVGDNPQLRLTTSRTMSRQYGPDGVDVDYEDFAAVETAGTAVAWQYILTHAPVAPWFSPGLWAGNAYLGAELRVFFFISKSILLSLVLQPRRQRIHYLRWAPDHVLEHVAPNPPYSRSPPTVCRLNKLVIGKPATTADAGSGYMDPATLSACLVQAVAQGWSAGAMTWQYPNGGSAWITEVRSGAFPVGYHDHDYGEDHVYNYHVDDQDDIYDHVHHVDAHHHHVYLHNLDQHQHFPPAPAAPALPLGPAMSRTTRDRPSLAPADCDRMELR
ncbi:Glycoside hydrolase [Mycena sanguinolenta]|uniref:Glycoside hydrolase n=1 Tax=Mycena sanguinolenta TaxID=230812 RepID=A0A8H6WPW1_9AGAR|nr:Glycoside hydrolase [Mycena sanguinolenta]